MDSILARFLMATLSRSRSEQVTRSPYETDHDCAEGAKHVCATQRACWPTQCHCHCTKAQGASDRFCVRACSFHNFIWRVLGSPRGEGRLLERDGPRTPRTVSRVGRYLVPIRLIDSPAATTFARLPPSPLVT